MPLEFVAALILSFAGVVYTCRMAKLERMGLLKKRGRGGKSTRL